MAGFVEELADVAIRLVRTAEQSGQLLLQSSLVQVRAFGDAPCLEVAFEGALLTDDVVFMLEFGDDLKHLQTIIDDPVSDVVFACFETSDGSGHVEDGVLAEGGTSGEDGATGWRIASREFAEASTSLAS